jgi:hypothetical protein
MFIKIDVPTVRSYSTTWLYLVFPPTQRVRQPAYVSDESPLQVLNILNLWFRIQSSKYSTVLLSRLPVEISELTWNSPEIPTTGAHQVNSEFLQSD